MFWVIFVIVFHPNHWWFSRLKNHAFLPSKIQQYRDQAVQPELTSCPLIGQSSSWRTAAMGVFGIHKVPISVSWINSWLGKSIVGTFSGLGLRKLSAVYPEVAKTWKRGPIKNWQRRGAVFYQLRYEDSLEAGQERVQLPVIIIMRISWIATQSVNLAKISFHKHSL